MAIESINPTTGERINVYDAMTDEEVATIVEETHRTFLVWKRTEYAVRATMMHKAAGILRERAVEYGTLMAQEMGKPVKDGKAEAEKWKEEHAAVVQEIDEISMEQIDLEDELNNRIKDLEAELEELQGK